MRRRMKVVGSLVLMSLFSLLLVSSRAHAAGWVIQMHTRRGPTTLSLDEQLGAKMAYGQTLVISRIDQQRVYQVNTAKGTYVSMDWKTFQQHRKRVAMALQNRIRSLSPQRRAAIQQRLRQRLQSMPAGQRSHVEKMLQRYMGTQEAPSPPPKITYKKTGRHQTINGFNTWQVIRYANDQRDKEFWVAAVPQWQRIGQTWQQAFEIFPEVKDNLPYEELGGLPIRMTDGRAVAEVRSIQPQSFTADDFSPPPGARRVLPMGRKRRK